MHTPFEHDLVDELRITVHPVIQGMGVPFFGRTNAPVPLRLLDSRRLGHHLTYNTHEIARAG